MTGYVRMTPGERMIYATAFAYAWGTRFEAAEATVPQPTLATLACEAASAAAAAVHVFRLAALHLPAADVARPYLDDMLGTMLNNTADPPKHGSGA